MSQTVYNKIAVDQTQQKTLERTSIYALSARNVSHPRVACISIFIHVNTSALHVADVVAVVKT